MLPAVSRFELTVVVWHSSSAIRDVGFSVCNQCSGVAPRQVRRGHHPARWVPREKKTVADRRCGFGVPHWMCITTSFCFCWYRISPTHSPSHHHLGSSSRRILKGLGTYIRHYLYATLYKFSKLLNCWRRPSGASRYLMKRLCMASLFELFSSQFEALAEYHLQHARYSAVRMLRINEITGYRTAIPVPLFLFPILRKLLSCCTWFCRANKRFGRHHIILYNFHTRTDGAPWCIKPNED